MPIRFDNYRMRDGVTPLSEDFFNGVFGDIDTRIAQLEEKRADYQAALDELTKFGLQRIDFLIGPSMDDVNAMLADLRARRDELVAAIGNVGDLASRTELLALANTVAGINKTTLGLDLVDNVSAADLRDRATHTGEQPMASITGLATALGTKATELVTLSIASNTTAVAGRWYECDTSAGAFNLTLPATAVVGARIGICDIKRTFGLNALTLLRNGLRIEGVADDLMLDGFFRGVLEYRGADLGWVITRFFA